MNRAPTAISSVSPIFTRKVKISSPHQWDILANLGIWAHKMKHSDIQCVGINTYLQVSARGGGILTDAKTAFLPSIFPRIAAAIFVFLLIGSLSLVCAGGVALVGPMLIHGGDVEHTDGRIISIGPDKDFVLETASGQHLVFQCGDQCRASLGHMQRHLRERAHTDVYYIEGTGKRLMALNVD